MTKQYFGVQTQKAIKNFPFSFRRTPKVFLYAIVELKKAAALAHFAVGELDQRRKKAIVQACDEILAGKLDNQFVLPAFQGGAGTSNHMNVNEAIASRASEILGRNLSVAKAASPQLAPSLPRLHSASPPEGEKNKVLRALVHPNDHVNMSHSTNDVMPSALRIAAIRLTDNLLATLDQLIGSLETKAKQFKDITKLGRTHLQDAVPVSLGGEFAAYAEYVRRGQKRIAVAKQDLLELNLGGSAVGNAINASPKYIRALYQQLQKVTKLSLRQGKNMMALTSSDTDFVALSQALTALCADLSKMANDIRFLSSGPIGGFAEFTIPELQAGSSIMPGKVNPVLPEAVNQLYFLVSGNNLTIEKAAEGSQLELGVMLPVLTDRLIESLTLMDELLQQYAKRCIDGIKVKRQRIKFWLEKSTAYATLLSPIIGYDQTSDLVKESVKSGKTIRELVLEKKLMGNKAFDQLVNTFQA